MGGEGGGVENDITSPGIRSSSTRRSTRGAANAPCSSLRSPRGDGPLKDDPSPLAHLFGDGSLDELPAPAARAP